MENNPAGVRKGSWTKEEDILLKQCIDKYGEGKWHLVPLRAGLNRCRKSCRLRWLNYLSPNIKRGLFTRDEVDLIIRLHKLLGNRWSLIAGRLPGRTGNDVKNFWNTHCDKKLTTATAAGEPKIIKGSNIIKPQPRTFSKLHLTSTSNCPTITENANDIHKQLHPGFDAELSGKLNDQMNDEPSQWWNELLDFADNNEEGCVCRNDVDIFDLVNFDDQMI